jgi:hypothetical protein
MENMHVDIVIENWHNGGDGLAICRSSHTPIQTILVGSQPTVPFHNESNGALETRLVSTKKWMTGFFPDLFWRVWKRALYPRTYTHHDVMKRSFRQGAAAEESVQREVNKLVFRSDVVNYRWLAIFIRHLHLSYSISWVTDASLRSLY